MIALAIPDDVGAFWRDVRHVFEEAATVYRRWGHDGLEQSQWRQAFSLVALEFEPEIVDAAIAYAERCDAHGWVMRRCDLGYALRHAAESIWTWRG